MPDYCRIYTNVLYSENSDYSDPKVKTNITPYTSTTATHVQHWLMTVGTGSAETIALDNWTTVETFVLKNKESTNYVTVTISDRATATTTDDTVIRVAAGRVLVTPDVGAGSSKTITIQANTSAVDVECVLVGT